MTTANAETPRSYAEVIKDSTDEDEIKCQPKQSIPKGSSTEIQYLRRIAPPFFPRFGHFFYGYCFICGKFGHKAVNYFQRGNFETRNNSANLRWPWYNNIFVPLGFEIECYKCNNLGHTSRYCRMTMTTVRNEQMSNNKKGNIKRYGSNVRTT